MVYFEVFQSFACPMAHPLLPCPQGKRAESECSGSPKHRRHFFKIAPSMIRGEVLQLFQAELVDPFCPSRNGKRPKPGERAVDGVASASGTSPGQFDRHSFQVFVTRGNRLQSISRGDHGVPAIGVGPRLYQKEPVMAAQILVYSRISSTAPPAPPVERPLPQPIDKSICRVPQDPLLDCVTDR